MNRQIADALPFWALVGGQVAAPCDQDGKESFWRAMTNSLGDEFSLGWREAGS
jgi:hypothetical protein